MKGISVMIGAVLIIIISIAVIGVIIQASSPGIERSQEILTYQNAKSNIIKIDNSIKSVSYQGQGASIEISLTSTEGRYFIDDNDLIYFLMDTKSQIVGSGVSKIEDELNVTGSTGSIRIEKSYTNVDFKEDLDFSATSRTKLIVVNNGYEETANKQIISIIIK